jgi:hypothetical protein
MMTPVAGGASGARFSQILVTQAMSLRRMTDIFDSASNAHVTVL